MTDRDSPPSRRPPELADDMTRQVKAGLSKDAGVYLDFDPDAAVGATG